MVIFLRSIFVWVTGLLLTLFLGILAIALSLVKAQNQAHRVAIAWGKALGLLSGIDIEINNEKKIYRDGPIVILSNHQSMFDIIVFYSFLDIQFRWMAKSSLFKIPVFGRAMSGAGYIPVDREDPKKAKETLFLASEMIKKGTSVLLFPEGTRGKPDGEMLPFKKGGFVLAKMAGVTIQPITIWGANAAVPKQKDKWLQRIYPALVQVYIHDPIHPEEFQNLSAEQLSAKVRSILESPVPKLKIRQEVEDSLKTW